MSQQRGSTCVLQCLDGNGTSGAGSRHFTVRLQPAALTQDDVRKRAAQQKLQLAKFRHIISGGHSDGSSATGPSSHSDNKSAAPGPKPADPFLVTRSTIKTCLSFLASPGSVGLGESVADAIRECFIDPEHVHRPGNMRDDLASFIVDSFLRWMTMREQSLGRTITGLAAMRSGVRALMQAYSISAARVGGRYDERRADEENLQDTTEGLLSAQEIEAMVEQKVQIVVGAQVFHSDPKWKFQREALLRLQKELRFDIVFPIDEQRFSTTKLHGALLSVPTARFDCRCPHCTAVAQRGGSGKENNAGGDVPSQHPDETHSLLVHRALRHAHHFFACAASEFPTGSLYSPDSSMRPATLGLAMLSDREKDRDALVLLGESHCKSNQALVNKLEGDVIGDKSSVKGKRAGAFIRVSDHAHAEKLLSSFKESLSAADAPFKFNGDSSAARAEATDTEFRRSFIVACCEKCFAGVQNAIAAEIQASTKDVPSTLQATVESLLIDAAPFRSQQSNQTKDAVDGDGSRSTSLSSARKQPPNNSHFGSEWPSSQSQQSGGQSTAAAASSSASPSTAAHGLPYPAPLEEQSGKSKKQEDSESAPKPEPQVERPTPLTGDREALMELVVMDYYNRQRISKRQARQILDFFRDRGGQFPTDVGRDEAENLTFFLSSLLRVQRGIMVEGDETNPITMPSVAAVVPCYSESVAFDPSDKETTLDPHTFATACYAQQFEWLVEWIVDYWNATQTMLLKEGGEGKEEAACTSLNEPFLRQSSDPEFKDLTVEKINYRVSIAERPTRLRNGNGNLAQWETEGKAENQLHSIQAAVQTDVVLAVDMNQDGFLHEGLKLPWFLHRYFGGEVPRYAAVGIHEKVYSGNATIMGDVTKSAEFTFNSITMRVMGMLGVKRHFGHGEFFLTSVFDGTGGTSKASPSTNVNEDVFAGGEILARRLPIGFCEALMLEKGREAAFFAASGFWSKIFGGYSQILPSVDNYAHAQHSPLLERWAKFFTWDSYYLVTVVSCVSMFLYATALLLFAVSDVTFHNLGLLQSKLAASWTFNMGILNLLPFFIENVNRYGWRGIFYFIVLAIPMTLYFGFALPWTTYSYFVSSRQHQQDYVATGRGFQFNYAKKAAFITDTVQKFGFGALVPVFKLLLLLLWQSWITVEPAGGHALRFLWHYLVAAALIAPFLFHLPPSAGELGAQVKHAAKWFGSSRWRPSHVRADIENDGAHRVIRHLMKRIQSRRRQQPITSEQTAELKRLLRKEVNITAKIFKDNKDLMERHVKIEDNDVPPVSEYITREEFEDLFQSSSNYTVWYTGQFLTFTLTQWQAFQWPRIVLEYFVLFLVEDGIIAIALWAELSATGWVLLATGVVLVALLWVTHKCSEKDHFIALSFAYLIVLCVFFALYYLGQGHSFSESLVALALLLWLVLRLLPRQAFVVMLTAWFIMHKGGTLLGRFKYTSSRSIRVFQKMTKGQLLVNGDLHTKEELGELITAPAIAEEHKKIEEQAHASAQVTPHVDARTELRLLHLWLAIADVPFFVAVATTQVVSGFLAVLLNRLVRWFNVGNSLGDVVSSAWQGRRSEA